MKSEPFRGQVVIVTGASAGLGRALALRLARQGAKVAIAARRASMMRSSTVPDLVSAAMGVSLVSIGAQAETFMLSSSVGRVNDG